MTSHLITPTSVIREYPAELKKGPIAGMGEPLVDHEGNILPYPTLKADKEDKYGQVSTIPRLAAVAALGGKVPTAGEYAIEHSKEPLQGMHIPPKCFLYDEDRPWVLGKLNPAALDLPEPAEPVPLPQHVLDKLDALDAAASAAIKQRTLEEAALDQAQGNGPVQKAVTFGSVQKKSVPVKAVEAKVDSAMKHPTKPKSRNSSVSPGKGPVVRESPVRNSSQSPRTENAGIGGRPKTPRSPGRGVSPQAKIVSSPRSGSKKIMNAKIDLEIVEKKN